MLSCEQLEQLVCDAPECRCGGDGPVEIQPPCHGGAPAFLCYWRGYLILQCAACREYHAVVVVAKSHGDALMTLGQAVAARTAASN